MGVFTRSDSPYYWLYLETTRTKERTDVVVGATVTQRHDSRVLADQVYHRRMNEIAARVHRLPTAKPSLRFRPYAEQYRETVIPHHKGCERERELLKVLIGAFGDELLQTLDREHVQRWMIDRRQHVSARTVNRELDLLKSMLRDAVPKYLEASPIVGMKRLKVIAPKRRLMTDTEERKLLKASRNPAERALIINGVDSLVRMGDLLDLQRADRKGRWIYLVDPKGEAADVALSPRGAAALDAIPGSHPYYFHAFRGAKTERDRRSLVRRLLKKLCAKAKVPYGRAVDGITFHWATRRTGATRMLLKKGVPLSAVQRQGTWKNPDVLLQIYAEAGRADMRKAVAPFPLRSRARRKSA